MIFNCDFFTKANCAFLLQGNIQELSNNFQPRRTKISLYYLLDEDFKGTVVNRALILRKKIYRMMVTGLETSYAGPGGHLVGLLTHIVGLFSGAFDAFSGALAHLVGLLTHLVGLLTHLVGLLTTKTPPRLFLQPPSLHNNAILFKNP